jgi:hypothetical protein
LAIWEREVGLYGWENVVDHILASPKYNNSFADDAVPAGCRAGCGIMPVSSECLPICRILGSSSNSILTGKILSELGLLSNNLQTIHLLVDNQFMGSLPAEIGALNNLYFSCSLSFDCCSNTCEKDWFDMESSRTRY